MSERFRVVEPYAAGDMWTCWCDDHSVSGNTREEAIFWAGWWAGRRELLRDVTKLVDEGAGARVVTYDDDAFGGKAGEG